MTNKNYNYQSNATNDELNNPESKGRANPMDLEVSKRLKMRRIYLGISQQELGKAADVSIQQVQKYEKGENRISSGKLFSFAKFLKVPVGYFFEHDEEHKEFSLNNAFAEEADEYNGSKSKSDSSITEKEVLLMIRAFGGVKNPQLRKKIVELLRLVS